jgi:hypothetical protein
MAGQFKALDRIQTLTMKSLNGPEAKAQFIAFARRNLSDTIFAGEASTKFTRIVNQQRDADEQSTIMPNPIIYEFDYLRDVALYALKYLEARYPITGPSEQGHYKDSHFAMQGGRLVEPSMIKPGIEVVITNDQPYSRKIQLGSKGFQVGSGIYSQAAQVTRRTWGQLVQVEMTYITLSGGQKIHNFDRTKKIDLRYPALLLNPLH